MTPPNDPRFSRPQPMPYAPQGYPQHEQPQAQGTVVMSRAPLTPEPQTLVYRPKGTSSYPPPQAASHAPQMQHQQIQQQQMQMQMQQPQQSPQPAHYAQRPPIQPYAQLQPGQAYQQAPSYTAPPSQHAPQSYAPPPSYAPPSQAAPVGFGFAGVGLMTPKVPGMDAFDKIKGPSGMPSALAFGFGIVAVVVALVFDVIFLNVNVPGVGGYAWYLSTALSFAAAGFAGAKFTKATRSVALTAIGVAGAIYGFADLGLGVALEHMPMGEALFLGIQGVVIAIFTGSGGVVKGLRARA